MAIVTTQVPPKSVVPVGYDVNVADAQTTAGNQAIDSAQVARDKIIQARLDEQTSLQAGQERDVEKNYTNLNNQINQQTYDAQETQKAVGVQRGIQYSQQQQALEGGIAMQGTSLRADATTNRDGALLNIKDRIASLRNTASLETQASQSQASSEKSTLVQQQNAKYEGWTREDAVQKKAFDNQIEIMGIDQQNKINLQNLDFEHQKVFMSLDHAQQTKIATMNNSAQIGAQATQGKLNRQAQANAQTEQIKAQADSDSKAQNKEMFELAGNMVMNRKGFDFNNDTDKREYLTAIGMPTAQINTIVKTDVPLTAFKSAVSSYASSKGVTIKNDIFSKYPVSSGQFKTPKTVTSEYYPKVLKK